MESCCSSSDSSFYQETPILENQYYDDVVFQRALNLFVPQNLVSDTRPDLVQLGRDVIAPSVFEWITDAERNTPYIKENSHDTLSNSDSQVVMGEGWRQLQAFGQSRRFVACGYDNKRAPMRRVNSASLSAEINGVRISRLKNKMGTRPLPTAELELDGMRGWLIGEEGRGAEEIAVILNITRVHSAIAAMGYVGRGLAIAKAYARVRTVRSPRGKRMFLAENSLHLNTLANMTAEYQGLMLLSIFCAYVLGLDEHQDTFDAKAAATSNPVLATLTPPQNLITPLLRVLTQITKAYVCKNAIPILYSCMEAMGGAGYLNNEESEYLNVSRIYRDCCVLAIWEGTTDVLSADFIRAMKHPQTGAASVAALDFVISKTWDTVKDKWDIDYRPSVAWEDVKRTLANNSVEEVMALARNLLFETAELLIVLLLKMAAQSEKTSAAKDIFSRFVEGKRLDTDEKLRSWSVVERLARDQTVVYGSVVDEDVQPRLVFMRPKLVMTSASETSRFFANPASAAGRRVTRSQAVPSTAEALESKSKVKDTAAQPARAVRVKAEPLALRGRTRSANTNASLIPKKEEDEAEQGKEGKKTGALAAATRSRSTRIVKSEPIADVEDFGGRRAIKRQRVSTTRAASSRVESPVSPPESESEHEADNGSGSELSAPLSSDSEEYVSDDIRERKAKRTARKATAPRSQGRTLMQMRKPGGIAADAAVDTMGCERLADRSASPRDQRFHTLIALMLSSQTKDTVTAVVMKKLQTELPPFAANAPAGLNLDNVLAVHPDTLNEMIWAVGFHNNKTKYIKQTAEILRDKWNGDIPDSIVGLTSLPGVGPKMAYLCLSHAWHRTEGIGVDVHVHRLANMWRWVRTRSPEETRVALQSWLPHDRWAEINWLLVGFGQTVCPSAGRNCSGCDVGLADLCPAADKRKVAEGRKWVTLGGDRKEEGMETKVEGNVKGIAKAGVRDKNDVKLQALKEEGVTDETKDEIGRVKDEEE
ncbi:hypothetical protein CFO_g2765 [Ceratocystis platani]|uniref:Endonuclease III homolog n=1 Tax=Ceratocystis fimbriata f. sp. platani TaxID=88771 RepID=A0A0F8DFY6_CERFI|nr:hypothetical protein CFO_g2765 [Ceratocystis platani]